MAALNFNCSIYEMQNVSDLDLNEYACPEIRLVDKSVTHSAGNHFYWDIIHHNLRVDQIPDWVSEGERESSNGLSQTGEESSPTPRWNSNLSWTSDT